MAAKHGGEGMNGVSSSTANHASAANKTLRVAFCHPDLGLGGAERLVVDAAVELSTRGHSVDVYTAYYDRNRCFKETKAGYFPVIVAGNWFPRKIFGRCHALCAYIRCLIVALYIALCAWRSPYDIIFVDQVSVVIPVLQFLTSAKVLFYCHFPDLLLANHAGQLRRSYRAPLDWLEQLTTGMADRLFVNSNFTKAVFAQTFVKLATKGIEPVVMYPAVHIPDPMQLQEAEAKWKVMLPPDLVTFIEGGPTFLSINRFERKKNIGLAIDALALLLDKVPSAQTRLVIAGGYDARVTENVQHLKELQDQAKAAGLSHRVAFLPSFSDEQRAALLAACLAVVYTPPNEHFGIVPLEAMACQRPVIACNSGGPTESIAHNNTGFLCEPTPHAFADCMEYLLTRSSSKSLGMAARQHVESTFSRHAFGDRLEQVVLSMCKPRK